MHSRVFNVTKNKKNFEDFLLCEEEVYDLMGGICDYVSDDVSLEDDVYWLLGEDLFKKAKKKHCKEMGIDYYVIPYSVIKEYVKEKKKKKFETIKTALKENLKDVLDYYGERKEFTSKNIFSIAMKSFELSDAINSKHSMYIHCEDDFLTLDKFMIYHLEKMKEGESLYVFQSFDYHF